MSIQNGIPCVSRSPLNTTNASQFSSCWSSFTRRTSSGRVISAIDGLRSLAIFAVIMHHLGGFVALKTPGLDFRAVRQTVAYRATNVANCGVQLFFVISGFILSLPFAEHSLRGGKAVALSRYLKRRAYRLHPPYLLNLAVMAMLLWSVKGESWSEVGPHLLASSFYLHNLIYHSMSSINGVAWSLEVEVQFCLLAPLFTLVYRVRPTMLRRGLLGAGIAAVMLWKAAAGSGIAYPLSGSIFYYADFFLAGLLLADVYVNSPRHRCEGSVGTIWNWLGLAGLAASVGFVVNEALSYLLPVGLALICAAALWAPLWNRFFSLPVMAGFGGMCYTTYLYHFSVISLVGRLTAPLTAGWSYSLALACQATVIFPAILAVSAILFVLVEKPFMSNQAT